jgi:hypothetical protein
VRLCLVQTDHARPVVLPTRPWFIRCYCLLLLYRSDTCIYVSIVDLIAVLRLLLALNIRVLASTKFFLRIRNYNTRARLARVRPRAHAPRCLPAAYKYRCPCCARSLLQTLASSSSPPPRKTLAGRRFSSALSPPSRRREALREPRMEVRSTLVRLARDSAFHCTLLSSPDLRRHSPSAVVPCRRCPGSPPLSPPRAHRRPSAFPVAIGAS